MNRQQRRKLEREKKNEHHNIDKTDTDEHFAGKVSLDIPSILYEWHKHDFTEPEELHPFELMLFLWQNTSSVHHNQLYTLYKENNLTITEILIFLGRFFIDPSGEPMSNRRLEQVKDYININATAVIGNKSYYETQDLLKDVKLNSEHAPKHFEYASADIIAKVLSLQVTEVNNAIDRINDLSLEWKWYNLMTDHVSKILKL